MSIKTIRLHGLELKLAAAPEQIERVRASLPYRYLIRPTLAAARRRRERQTPGGAPAVSPTLGLPAPVVSLGDGSPAAAAIRERVGQVRWYHTIEVGHGVVTPGFVDRRGMADRYGLPADLTGRRCLDIGTYDGFWAFEMERRGAAEVVAMDVDSPTDLDIPRREKRLIPENATALRALGIETIGAGFRLAKELRGSAVRREAVNIYELSPERLGTFDVVFLSEVLLHLRDPQTALENIFSVTRGMAIIAEPFSPELERLDAPTSEFVGTARLGIWWQHSVKSQRKMMAVAGFNPIDEVGRLTVDNRLGRFQTVVLRGHAPADAATSAVSVAAGAISGGPVTAVRDGSNNADHA